MSQGSLSYDHEIHNGTSAKGLRLIRDDKNQAMYQVIEEIPTYQNPLRFTMDNWLGGHGQYDFLEKDMYFEGQSIDTTQDGRIFLGPLINQVGVSGGALDAAPTCFCWFSAISKLMLATTSQVYWYDGTNFVSKTTITGKTISHMYEFNGVLYVAIGASDLYYYTADGVTYTQTDLTDGYAVKFFGALNAAGTSNVLWKYKTPNQISSTTDGRTVAAGGVQWTSPAYIGDTSNNITNIFLVNGNLMIGREDNLYHYNTDGGIQPLMNDLKHNRSTNNFKYVVDWQTASYFSLGRGLGEIIAYDAFDPMGPLSKTGNIGKVGDCVGLASDKDFLYVVMDEGTNSHIYKGCEVRRDGVLRWEWCPWVFLSTNACTTAHVVQHTATDRRLWFGYGSTYAAYVILTDNPTTDTAARFAASGWIRFSYTYGTNPYWDKMWQSVVTETKGCTANLTVTPKYLKDTDTSASALTAAIITNGVVKTNLTTQISCKRISFQLDLATNSGTATPEVLFFEARGVEKPETVRIHEATYAIGDTPSRKTETIRSFFRTARTSTTLLKFADLRYGEKTSGTAGTDYVYVVIPPGGVKEVEVAHEKNKAPELGLACRFQEVSYS